MKADVDAVAIQGNPVFMFESNLHTQDFCVKSLGLRLVSDAVVSVLYADNQGSLP